MRLLTLTFMLLGVSVAVAQRFRFPDMSWNTDLTKVNALKDSGSILLTGEAQQRAGALWFVFPVDITKSFMTEFAFTMAGPGADGMALVFQSQSPDGVGLDQSGLGYAGLRTAVALEFDTFQNTDYDDPSENHMSLHLPHATSIGGTTYGNPSEQYTAFQHRFGNAINVGNRHTVIVNYNATSHRMTFNVDGKDLVDNCLPGSGCHSVTGSAYAPVNLQSEMGQTTAYMGFTAATGRGKYQDHLIRSWRFEHTADEACAAGFDINNKCQPVTSNGAAQCDGMSDCETCSNADAPCVWDSGSCAYGPGGASGVTSPLDCPSSTSYTWVWILVSVAVIIIGTIVALWWFKRKARNESVDSSYGYL